MGIRSLHTFMKTEVPNGCIQINIIEEASNFKRMNNGKSPIIVFDIMSLIEPLQHNKKDLLCGGRYQLTLEMIDNLFSTLKSNGIILEFFCDGPVFDLKVNKWTVRQKERYEKNLQVLHKIYDNSSLDDIINDRHLDLNNTLGIVSGLLIPCAKQYGTFNVACDKECDTELASYATKVNALAIISNDSDFLIFNGNWKYWSSDIDFKNLSTTHFNRLALQSYLNISAEQLPLLATLAGNDFMTYDDLKRFSYRMGPSNRKFQNIANFIRNLENTAFNLDFYELEYITESVFANGTSNNIQKIENSINIYNLNYEKSVCNKNPMFNNMESVAVTWILNRTFRFGFKSYSDLNKSDIKSEYSLSINLFRREMGIVLYDQKKMDVTRRFGRFNKSGEYEFMSVKPDYPEFDLPKYEDFINDKNTEFNTIRWNLLCWIISDNLNADDVKKIPKEYLIYVLLLFYLVEQKQLTTLEADAFLITIDAVHKKRISKVIEYPKYLNERTTRITHFFNNMFEHILRCFNIVCLSDYAEYLLMDNVYFHNMVENLKNLSEEIYQSTIEEIFNYRIYVNNSK